MPFDIRAYMALVAFVPLSLAVFAATPKHRSVAAIFNVYIGGLLFLPELAAFDFPLLPPMDKNGFAGLMAFIGALVLERKRIIAAKPLRGVDAFFWVILIGNAGTAFTNPDVLVYGKDLFKPDGEQVGFRIALDAMRPYDILSMGIRDFLAIYVPFLLGRAIFRNNVDAEIFLKGFIIFCLVYAPFMLLELRLSPQFHNWTYGYAPNKFFHAVRGDGFKPTVYLNNGLAVAMLLLAGIISSAILLKRRATLFGLPMIVPLGFLWLLLGLSKNMGATLYSLAAVPIILASRGRMATMAAMVLAIAVIAYPIARAGEMVDTAGLIEAIEKVRPDRAQSLNTRFVNEDVLWQRASERKWFGWGGYGRNRIYDDWGKDISITDGEWIIRIGGRGIIGFIGSFGFLLFPIFIARRRLSKIADPADRKIVDGLSLLIALNAVDLLPNGLFTQMPFFMAGALAGLAQGMSQPTAQRPR